MHHLVYMCRDSFPHFIFEHTCRIILLMENRLFRAAGVFWGVCPSLWLSLALSNVSDRLHIPLSLHVPGMPLCFFLCLCMHHPGRSQVLLLWSSSSFPFCVHVFICLSLSFFSCSMSPSITVTLSPSLIYQPVTLATLNFPSISCCCCCAHMCVVRGAEGQS